MLHGLHLLSQTRLLRRSGGGGPGKLGLHACDSRIQAPKLLLHAVQLRLQARALLRGSGCCPCQLICHICDLRAELLQMGLQCSPLFGAQA